MLYLMSRKDGVSFSGRGSHSEARTVYPPNGDPLVRLRISCWRFFTDSRQQEDLQLFLDTSNARILRDELTRALRA